MQVRNNGVVVGDLVVVKENFPNEYWDGVEGILLSLPSDPHPEILPPIGLSGSIARPNEYTYVRITKQAGNPNYKVGTVIDIPEHVLYSVSHPSETGNSYEPASRLVSSLRRFVLREPI